MLTYKFRLYPTKAQEKKLEETLAEGCTIGCWMIG
jgi:transposase